MWFRSVLVAAVLGAALAGCSSPSNPTRSDTTRTLTGVTVAGVAPAVGATLPYTATANWSDGVHEDVTSSAAWASSNPAVLSVTATGMVTGVAAGSATLSATYQAKTGTSPVTVVAPTCNFTVSPLSFSLPKTGGTVAINVTMTGAPCAWDAFTGHSFMSVLSGASGFGNGSIVVSMDPNADLARQGSVIVSHRFVVLFNQAQSDCVVSVTPAPASLPAAGGAVTVGVAAPPGCTWRAILPSAQVRFLNAQVGSGNGSFDILAWVNGTGATRPNEVTVEHLKVVVPQDVPHGTYFIYTSDAADVIGRGADALAQAPQQSIMATAVSASEVHFSMQAQLPPPASSFLSYDLSMRAPNGQALVPGTYLNANAGVGASPALPYLNLLKQGSSDCRPTGFFTVREAVYGPGSSIVRFWATFEQSCEASPTSRLRGEISFGR